MKKIKKILLSCMAVLLVGAIGYGAYYLFHYVLYDDYKELLTELTYDEGKEFQAMQDSDPNIEGMVLVSENDNMKMYTNTKTCEVAIYDKRNGEIIYSNPVDAEQDAIAKDVNISYLKSQLILEYYNANNALSMFNSYDNCTKVGNYEVQSIENGIRYIYTIGVVSSSDIIVPDFITKERLDVFLNTLIDAGAEADAKYIKKRYQASKLKEGFLELSAAAKKGQATLNKINKYLIAAGYTKEDYYADMAEAGVEVEQPLSFVIPLEYRLEEDGIRVSVNTEHIKEINGGQLYRIQLLRAFGAGSSTEDGYIVLPNGSGSLMYFNNGKFNSQEYMQFLYGLDPLVADVIVVEKTETARLPIYGIQHQNYGILASIESGDSLASITACVAGKYNSYNCAYPSFFLRGSDIIDFAGESGNESSATVVEDDFYKVNLEVKYTVLTKEYEGYSGMANYYRNQLIADGKLQLQDTANTEFPFYLDVIGALKRTNFILGKQYNETFAVTTYEEAGKMIDTLNEGGIHNIVMNYQGWFNRGYYHDVTDKIALVKKLGSEKELERLSAKLESNGGKLYGDTAFQKVAYTTKRYKDSIETSRYFSTSYQVIFGQVHPSALVNLSSLGYRDTLYYLISPRFLPRYVNDFTEEISSIDITGISLRDLGDMLASDKKRTHPINREYAKQVVEAQFEILQDTKKELMVKGGNSYSLPYASDILDPPLTQNDFFMVDEEIPWYQMIVHGCINYSGSVINLMSVNDMSDVVLKLLEYGAAPHFTLTYEDGTELKHTGLNMLFSTTFDVWKEDAISIYNEVNNVLKHVQGATIKQHEVLSAGVKKITYDNGVSIYVNTTNKAFTSGNITVPAKGYETEGVNK